MAEWWEEPQAAPVADTAQAANWWDEVEPPEATLGEDIEDLGRKAGATTLDLVGLIGDVLSPDPRPDDVSFLDQAAGGSAKAFGDFLGVDFLSRYGEKEQKRIAESFAAEDARRKASGELTLEEERQTQVGTSIAQFYGKKAEGIREGFSAEQKDVDKRLGKAVEGGIGDTASFLFENPGAAGTMFVESLPYMVAGGGIGRVASGTAKFAGAGEKLSRIAGVSGSVGGEAGVAAGANTQQVQGIIDNIPDSMLSELPEVKEMMAANPGMGLETVRSLLRDQAGSTTFATSLMTNLATLAVSQGLGANVVQDLLAGTGKQTAKGVTRRATEGFLKEAGQEFAQEGGDAIASGAGEVVAGLRDPEDLTADAAAQALLGASAGGAPGAAAGIIQGGKTDDSQPPPPEIEEESIDRIVEAALESINDPAALPAPEAEPLNLNDAFHEAIDEARQALQTEGPKKPTQPKEVIIESPEEAPKVEPKKAETKPEPEPTVQPEPKPVDDPDAAPTATVQAKDTAPVEQPQEKKKPFVTQAYKKTNLEAVKLKDGTFKVRTRPSSRAMWDPWESREKLDTRGLQPLTTKLKSGRIKVDNEFFQIQDEDTSVPPPKGPADLLQELRDAGGLNREAFGSEGVDEGGFADENKVQIGKPLFPTEDGMSLADLRQFMQDNGYLTTNEGVETTTDNDALEIIHAALSGDRVISDKNSEAESDFQIETQFIEEQDRQSIEDEFGPENVEETKDFYMEAYQEYENEFIPESETADPNESQAGRTEREASTPEPDLDGQGNLLEAATGEEETSAAVAESDGKRNGIGEDEVPVESGEGELFAGNEPGQRPEQTDIEDSPGLSDEVKALIAEAKETSDSPVKNKIFTESSAEEARNRLLKGKGGLFDVTQALADATVLAGYHVERGLRTFAKFSKVMIEEVGDWVKPYLADLYAKALSDTKSTPEGPAPTSTKNVVAAAERESRGLDPIEKAAVETHPETIAKAQSRMRNNPNEAQEVITRIFRSPEVLISPVEEAIMLLEKVRLRNLRDQQSKAIGSAKDDNAKAVAQQAWREAETAINEIDRATALSGTSWGRFGILRQRMMAADFTLEAMENRWRAETGEGLSEEQVSKVEAQAKIIEDLQKRIAASEKTAQDNDATGAVSDTYEKLEEFLEGTKPAEPSKPRFRKKAVAKLDVAADKARARMRAKLGRVSANPLFDPEIYSDIVIIGASHIAHGIDTLVDFAAAMKKEFGEMWVSSSDEEQQVLYDESRKEADKARVKTPEEVALNIETHLEAGDPLDNRTVYELAQAHILAGVHGEDKVMKAVHKDLEPFFEGLTERQVRRAFSDYGKVIFPSDEAHKVELRELRVLVRLQESIDRLREGRDALKTGMQRDSATQKIRERQAALNILQAERDAKNPNKTKEQLAGLNQARITRLENRIQDLKKEIDQKEKGTFKEPKKAKKVDDSPDVVKLKAKIEILKETLAEIERQKNPPKSPAQKQFEKLAETRDHLDRVLENREQSKQQKEFVPLSKESADLKAEIDDLRKAIAKMRRDTKGGLTPGERKELAEIKRLETAIRIYDRKIANGDFSALFKSDSTVSARVQALRELRDARRAVYMAAKKAQIPALSPEQKINRQRKRSMTRRMEDLQRRIDAGDFRPDSKRDPFKDDKEVAKLRYELDQKKSEFNDDLLEHRYKEMNLIKKFFVNSGKVLNLSRAIITSVDLSGVLRQGGFVVLGRPSLGLKNIMPMLRAFSSPAKDHAINESIKNRENAPLYEKAGLFIADQDTTDLSKMEEVYMSAWATEGIKIAGKKRKIPLVAGSSRAYVTFLNLLRADTFDALLATLPAGKNATLREMEAIGNYVNVATGRGKIGLKNQFTDKESASSAGLATVFFAPKYVASRFNLLSGQPFYGGTATTRKMIAKEYARYLSGLTVVLGLAFMAAKAFRDDDDEDIPIINFDPRSSDFLKIRIGNTRLDILSGLIQPSVLMARVFSGSRVNSKGDATALRDESRIPTGDLEPSERIPFGGQGAWQVMSTFVRSKFAPGVGSAINLMTGKNVVGEPTDFPTELKSLVTPLSLTDFYGMMGEQGIPKAVALQMLVTFGAGAQTYGDGGYSENKGAIDRIISDARKAVDSQPTEKAKQEEFKRQQAEHPWLLSGASLNTYSTISSSGRINTSNIVKGRAGKVKPGAPIKDLPEFVKGDDADLIKEINTARNKLKAAAKFTDVESIADHSAILKKAIEAGNLDRAIPRGMRRKIFDELEESALRIKQAEVAKIRSAKG